MNSSNKKWRQRKRNAGSLFKISKKHVRRDINKYDLNPSMNKENLFSSNLGPGTYDPQYQNFVRSVKIMPDIASSIVRETRK